MTGKWKPETFLALNLSRGIVVSPEDLDLLRSGKWKYNESKGFVYGQHGGTSARLVSVIANRKRLEYSTSTPLGHFDDDPLNCTRENVVSFEKRLARKNKTGFRGVQRKERRRQSGKVDVYFVATITHNEKVVHLGSFQTPERAALVYDAARVLLHGQVSNLNYPDRAGELSLADVLRARPKKGSKSNFLGVYPQPHLKKSPWRCSYTTSTGKTKTKRCKTEIDAAEAYDDFKHADTGALEGLNFPERFLPS